MAHNDERDEAHKRLIQQKIDSGLVEPYSQIPASETTKKRSTENNDNQSKAAKVYKFFFEGKAGVWTSASTVVMCIFSVLLWRVSSIANDNNIATQRATLTDNGPIWTKVLSADGKKLTGFNINFAWVNNGTLPASAGKSHVNLALGSDRPEESLDFSKLQQNTTISFVLGSHSAVQVSPMFISVEDVEEAEQGRKHLFFWGFATYHDGFRGSEPRLTEFCTDVQTLHWTKPDHTDPTVDVQASSPPCETHNCFDDECKDYEARTK